MTPCLAEDHLLTLAEGEALGADTVAEAHLADCATCSALLALLLDGPDRAAGWDELAGRKLGPYRLEAQIGAGGMGSVYRAWDGRLGRSVAIKVLATEAARRQELEGRLDAEARAAATIAHPNVVPVYDVGNVDGVAFVVQELVDGESLRSVLERATPTFDQALRLGLDLVAGLAAAHAKGVVHCDLKPENLIVTRGGPLKILDFGLAERGGDARVASTGAAWGTAGYASPEQSRGEPADTRSDIFAVGAILYELVTGRRAFDGATRGDRLAAVLGEGPRSDAASLGRLAPIVARCLERDPSRRFQSADDLAWVLERQLQPHAVTPPPQDNPRDGLTRPAISRRGLLLSSAVGAAAFAAGRFARWGEPAPTAPVFRQLTYREGRVLTARLTADGATLLYGAAWDGAPASGYALRLDGGAARPLAAPPGDVLAVSSRRELALSVDRRFAEGQSASGTLVIVPLDGGAPRPWLEGVQDADFTPDGRELIVVRAGGRGFRLEVPGSAPLMEVDTWISHPRVSPDGQRVACIVHPSTNDDAGDIVVIDRATRRARTLAAGFSSVSGLAWEPRGDALWFTASRGQSNNAVRAITREGRERVVAQTVGRLRLHDVGGGRKVVVSVDTWRVRSRLGGPLASGLELDRSMSELSMVMDISADGKALLVGELGDADGSLEAYLVPVAGGPALHVGPGLPLAISPDGRRVVTMVEGAERLLAVASTVDAEKPIVDAGPVVKATKARWVGDAELIVVGSARGRAPRLWRMFVGGASPAALTGEGSFGDPVVDGRRARVAFVDPAGRLNVVTLADGIGRVLAGAFRDEVACAWQDEGDALIVRTRTTPLRLARVDALTGARTAYLEIAPPPLGLRGVDSFVMRPDGQLFAYSYGEELSQLHLMLPGVDA